MKIGLSTYQIRTEHLVPLAIHLDQLGFEGMWMGEHLAEPKVSDSIHPPAYDAGKARVNDVTRARQMYDIFTAAGACLGATKRLKVTTGICIVPAKHPVDVARAAVTAQRISGGRFRLGMGAGWWPEELETLGIPNEHRNKRFAEHMKLLPKLFTGDFVESEGPMFPFKAARVTEEPFDIPLVFGGTGPKQLERTAKIGAGYYTPMLPKEQSLAIKAQIEALRAEYGRTTPFSFETRVRGEPKVSELQDYIDAGFDTLVIPAETFQGEAEYDMTLDDKFRRAEEIAKEFRLI